MAWNLKPRVVESMGSIFKLKANILIFKTFKHLKTFPDIDKYLEDCCLVFALSQGLLGM